MSNNIFFLLFFLCLITVGFYACNSTTTTTSSDSSSGTGEEYIELPTSKSIVDFVGKKIWLMGKEAEMVHQHMMKGPSPIEENDGDGEKHVYIDYNTNSQIVGYYKDFKIPKDGAAHKFYGKVLSMSGAGKGGGTHTEYYINLHKVE